MTDQATGSVLLAHKVGLHARPAVKLTKLAKRFSAHIHLGLSSDGPWVNAKSINKVMGAKIPQDVILYFAASGDDAEQAIAAMTRLVERDFHDDGLS